MTHNTGWNTVKKVNVTIVFRVKVYNRSGAGNQPFCDLIVITKDAIIMENANPEFVDKFCYLGDMLSVDGDADAVVETRIRIGWN